MRKRLSRQLRHCEYTPEHLFSIWYRLPARPRTIGLKEWSFALLPPNHLPILHHEIHILQQLDITQRVAADRDHIR
jgi:hypothetical protein